MTRAAVLGAGSWGTAFGKVLADAGLRFDGSQDEESVAKRLRDEGAAMHAQTLGDLL